MSISSGRGSATMPVRTVPILDRHHREKLSVPLQHTKEAEINHKVNRGTLFALFYREDELQDIVQHFGRDGLLDVIIFCHFACNGMLEKVVEAGVFLCLGFF